MLSRVHSDEISREILNFQDMDDITDSSEWKWKFSIFIQIWILPLKLSLQSRPYNAFDDELFSVRKS